MVCLLLGTSDYLDCDDMYEDINDGSLVMLKGHSISVPMMNATFVESFAPVRQRNMSCTDLFHEFSILPAFANILCVKTEQPLVKQVCWITFALNF